MTKIYEELERAHNAAKDLLVKADKAMKEKPPNLEKLKSLREKCNAMLQVIEQPKYGDSSFVQDIDVPVNLKANNHFFKDRLPELYEKLDKKLNEHAANIPIEADLKNIQKALMDAATLLKQYIDIEKPSTKQKNAMREAVVLVNQFALVLKNVQKNPNISEHNKLVADTLATQFERFNAHVTGKTPDIAKSLPVWQPAANPTRTRNMS